MALFSRYITCEQFQFKHAKGVSDRSGKEFHPFHEIILFQGGEAELISETVHVKLKPQTLIAIPKETYHQVVIQGKQEEYCRCVFQFEPWNSAKHIIAETMQELFVTQCDEEMRFLFEKMMRLAQESEKPFHKDIARGTLVLLLDEIRAKKHNGTEAELVDDVTKAALQYIAENLTQNYTMESLAKACNVSPSTLMHTFKKNMNITVHQYRLKKRLMLAHMKMADGESANRAAAECGFSDYSGFYRQYKRMFDKSPSGRMRK